MMAQSLQTGDDTDHEPNYVFPVAPIPFHQNYRAAAELFEMVGQQENRLVICLTGDHGSLKSLVIKWVAA